MILWFISDRLNIVTLFDIGWNTSQFRLEFN
jgi:hypothetical protein